MVGGRACPAERSLDRLRARASRGTAARGGRTARLRGTAFRVRGLAELVAFSGPVRARIGQVGGATGAWADVTSGRDGRFVVEAPVPLRDDDAGAFELTVEVGPRASARAFTVSTGFQSGVSLAFHTDRNLYEPGERAHLWALVTDRASRAPIAGREVRFSFSGDAIPQREHRVETLPSGVAHLAVPIPETAREENVSVTARVDGQLSVTESFRIGERSWERLLLDTEVQPELVNPGQSARLVVRATTTSGAPVVDASVSAAIGERSFEGRTDARGVATIEVRAPMYLSHPTATQAIRVVVEHPAHGSREGSALMRLAVPLALSFEANTGHGYLVPEVDDRLYVRLADGSGEPPASPMEVTIVGPGIATGSTTATTDSNGILAVPVRVPTDAGTWIRGVTFTMTAVSTASAVVPRVSRVSVPLAPHAQVVPTLDRVVVDPGTNVRVGLAKRPAAASRPVVLELLGSVRRAARGHLRRSVRPLRRPRGPARPPRRPARARAHDQLR